MLVSCRLLLFALVVVDADIDIVDVTLLMLLLLLLPLLAFDGVWMQLMCSSVLLMC